MSVVEVVLKLVVVAALASYLFLKHRQRARSWSEARDPAKWTGTAIDATKLMATVERVRQDYFAALQLPPHSIWYRRVLVELGQQAVRRLAWFRDRKTEDDATKHAT
jgi:hypothetical protein